jgi:hypothetical protein
MGWGNNNGHGLATQEESIFNVNVVPNVLEMHGLKLKGGQAKK